MDLHLNKKFFNDKTTFFNTAVTISHELRHLWQVGCKNSVEALAEYTTSDKVADIRAYNEQELEIDAWAWATYMMELQYGVHPTFDKISPEYTKQVLQRADVIKAEMQKG